MRTAARISSAIAPHLAARWLEHVFMMPSRRPLRPHESEWMADAQTETLRFDEKRRFPFYSWGSGPTVLLAHGWSGRGGQMGVFVRPLVDRGFRVVTWDAPGHGNAEGGLTGVPELATAMAQVADRVGPIQAVVAHSLGGAAATMAISRGLPVDRLVYIAPPENPGEYLYRVAAYLGFSPEAARRAQTRMERRFSYPFEKARGTFLAQELNASLLVIHDQNDREVPHGEGALLAAGWPGAVLMTTRGLGHHRILRDPEVLEATVRFAGGDKESGRRERSRRPQASHLESTRA